MKLRLRSLESKETVRLEIPNSCSLYHLKESLCQSIPSAPSSLHFSLNKKDELCASSSQETLHSLGVSSGDLIYYSDNPSAFVSQTLEMENRSVTVLEIDKEKNVPKSEEAFTSQDCEIPDAILDKQRHPVQESGKIEVSRRDSREPISMCSGIEKALVQETQKVKEKGASSEFIDNETMEIDEQLVVMPEKCMPEPYFLRRVLGEKLGDDIGPHGLVIVAVHEILLESGFVRFDSVSGMRIDLCDMRDQLLSKGVSITYTSPELLNDSANDVTEYVVLKYQALGHFVNVYGSLAKGDSGIHKLSLNAYKFGPIISLVWANSDKNSSLHDKDKYKSLDYGDEVFEFWKKVKDVLALPLLIDLCDKAGLRLPACWMHLPTELKLKILEYLPGVDVAKMECVSRETRYVASNNELWRQKFEEEFGGHPQGKNSWKDRFVYQWEYQEKRKRAITPWFPHARPYAPIIRDPSPFGNRFIQGGDFDRFPNMHIPPFPFGQRHQTFRRFSGRQNFSPNCNLGGP